MRLLHVKHRYDKIAQAYQLLLIQVDLLETYRGIQLIPVHEEQWIMIQIQEVQKHIKNHCTTLQTGRVLYKISHT